MLLMFKHEPAIVVLVPADVASAQTVQSLSGKTFAVPVVPVEVEDGSMIPRFTPKPVVHWNPKSIPSPSASSAVDVLRAAGAVSAVWCLAFESVYKSQASELRTSQDLLALSFTKAHAQCIRKSYTPQRGL